MKDRCERWETLTEAAALPAGDPRRDHLDRCARCSARLAATRAFLHDNRVPAGADVADADLRLKAVLNTEVLGAPVRKMRERHWTRFAGATAALAAALALIVIAPRMTSIEEAPAPGTVLRGEVEADAFELQSEMRPDGALDLSWQMIAEADDYAVTLFDDSLAAMATVATGGRRSLAWPADEPAPAFWLVTALAKGDPIATSRAAAIGAGSGEN